MAANPNPRITPYLLYEDVDAMLDWLAGAFGFRERNRQRRPDGKTVHAEMTLDDDGLILLGWPGPTYKNPKHLGQATQSLYVFVPNVDRHFERARQAGALVLEEPKDQPYGDRRYGARDPEGHVWYFAQPVGRER